MSNVIEWPLTRTEKESVVLIERPLTLLDEDGEKFKIRVQYTEDDFLCDVMDELETAGYISPYRWYF